LDKSQNSHLPAQHPNSPSGAGGRPLSFLRWLFAWRYFRSKKTTNAVNIIAWISVLAIAVGAAALIIVLSVFNGFEDLVKGLYGDFYADMRIAPAQGKFMTLSPEQATAIRKVGGVGAVSFIAEEKAVLTNGEAQTIIYLKGVDTNYLKVSRLQQHIVHGKYAVGDTDNPLIILGVGVESAIATDVSADAFPFVIYLPNRNAEKLNSLEAMNSAAIAGSGSFLVQQEFDNKYAFTNLPFVQYMLDLQPNQYSSIELSVSPHVDENKVQQQLQRILGNSFNVQTRYQQNASLFGVMQLEKWVIYCILCLILLIAAFNMIGALTMLVLEKQKDIAVLKAMGATNGMVQGIFLNEGLVLAGVGGGSGIVLAFLICFAQMKFKIIELKGGTFLINYYPVKMLLSDFVLVTVTIVIVALMAAWLPSRKAAQQFFSLKS
jgi:lipoprotein-releasing system permease protein